MISLQVRRRLEPDRADGLSSSSLPTVESISMAALPDARLGKWFLGEQRGKLPYHRLSTADSSLSSGGNEIMLQCPSR